MITNNIETLAMRASKRDPSDLKITLEEIHQVEKTLAIKFSDEFKKGNIIYGYDIVGSFDFHSFPQGVVQKALRLRRNANLPNDTLMLSEDDASVWLMKCLGDHEEIYWIAVEDYYHYCDNEPLEYAPTIFPTFTDFFAYLLDEAEKQLEGEQIR